ncbi:MAG TPA: Xaa-Pro peptidase family protein [Candidatus Angelobacter sp.]|nr:Xaa-Pro peptidase family protein [Candidatus Angelobacter sp.]
MVLLPIPYCEFLQRLERLRALMKNAKVQAILLGTGSNLRYFSGYPSPARSGSRPFFLVLPLSGDPILIVQAGRRAEATRFSWIKEIRDYPELSSVPTHMIQDALAECGALGGRLGMELGHEQSFDVPILEFRRLEEVLSGTTIVDVGDLLWQVRMIKSEVEVLYLRAACRILGEAYQHAFARAQEGDSERDIAGALRNYCMQAGADDVWVLMTSGKGNYVLTTKAPEDRSIRRGEMVWIDAGCSVGGYWSDFSRAAIVGEPSPQQIQAQEAIHEITRHALQRIAPGVKVSEIAHACNKGIDQLPFPIVASISGLASRCGHGLGLDVTEPPHVAEYDPTTLESGMVITVEPGIATEYGTFHIEEDVLVTHEGYEVLSECDRNLFSICLD